MPDTTPYIVRDIRSGLKAPRRARYWFDYGSMSLDSAYGPTHAVVRTWLRGQGKIEGRDFVIRRYEGATHNEASWRARLGDVLTFLYGQATDTVSLAVPAWSKDAIWYQIFVERFRNGDPANDPTSHDIEGVTDERPPNGWHPTPWSQDWYRPDPWAAATGKDFYGSVQSRRYGGDLQGVLDRLDYLQGLGVTALFLNPVNDAPSLHKYDARNYTHIDRNFGPDPRGDEARIAAEDPVNPGLVEMDRSRQFVSRSGARGASAGHARHHGLLVEPHGYRLLGLARCAGTPAVVAVRRLVRDRAVRRSSHAGHQRVSVQGMVRRTMVAGMEEFGRPPGQTSGPIEGNLVPGVRDLVFDVTRRWLDPNHDGDPSDGVDGFRLDVADVVPLGFWRDYRRFVRSINPEAYLVGEVWWEKWPDRLWDPAPWLKGDVFDAVMNYRWYTPTRSFFGGAPRALSASRYAAAWTRSTPALPRRTSRAMMNLTASHDTPRFGTAIYNRIATSTGTIRARTAPIGSTDRTSAHRDPADRSSCSSSPTSARRTSGTGTR